MISVYIPLYNNADWCKNLKLIDGFKYIASDNCSTDGSGDILREKGVKVITQPKNLGRVGNWEFCVNHFAQSDAQWLKWLFAGDSLLPDAFTKLEKAIAEYPDIRLIFGAYNIVDQEGSKLGLAFPKTQVITPEQCLYDCAYRGNIFGSPVGHCFHKEALKSGFSFGTRPWVADMQFYITLAEKFPLLYLAEPVGDCNVYNRLYKTKHQYSISTAIEEYFIRQETAAKYKNLTGDATGYDKLREKIDCDFEAKIIRNSLYRKEFSEDSSHIIQQIQKHSKASKVIVNGLSTKYLISSAIRRVFQKFNK